MSEIPTECRRASGHTETLPRSLRTRFSLNWGSHTFLSGRGVQISRGWTRRTGSGTRSFWRQSSKRKQERTGEKKKETSVDEAETGGGRRPKRREEAGGGVPRGVGKEGGKRVPRGGVPGPRRGQEERGRGVGGTSDGVGNSREGLGRVEPGESDTVVVCVTVEVDPGPGRGVRRVHGRRG